MSGMPLSRSIRARVTAGAFIIVAVVLGIGAFATVQVVSGALTESVRMTVEQDLSNLSSQLDDPRDAARTIDDLDGDLLVRLDGPRPIVNDDDAARLPRLHEERAERVMVHGEPYLAMTDDTDAGMLTVARPLEHVDDTISTTTVLLAIAVPTVLALIAAVVWIVTGRALAPVDQLRRQVDSIGATDLSRRVDAGDDELGALATTMNRMLARIEHAQKVQRRFVSDASHELRSPLATIRQHAEIAAVHPESTSLQALSGVVLSEGIRMQDLVEGLLLLARLDEHQQHPVEPVDLDDVALAEVARLRGMGISVDGSGIGAGRVMGSPVLLARAVRNLVDNAVRHAAGLVTIRVIPNGAWVHLQVEDDGAGVAPADRETIFDRFARLDEGRARDEGGSGLGLAIVREVALAHGGAIEVSSGPQGGALFTLTLPAAG